MKIKPNLKLVKALKTIITKHISSSLKENCMDTEKLNKKYIPSSSTSDTRYY